MQKHIRPIAVAVVTSDSRVLVEQGYDPVKDQYHYRPSGGGIDFGETSQQAVLREFREELAIDLANLRLINTYESLFEYNGQPGHEIVFVYAADFTDPALYGAEELTGSDAGGVVVKCVWLDMEEYDGSVPLYPEGLEGDLRRYLATVP